MRKGKQIAAIILFMACALVLTGCWDKRELEDLQIPNIESFDIALEREREYPDDKFLVSVGWPTISEKTTAKFHVEETPGSLIGETNGRRNTHVGEQMVLGQLQVLLFGEEFAKNENVVDYMDIMGRNPYVKGNVHLAVVKGRAVEVLKKNVIQYPNAGEYIHRLLSNIKKTNFYPETTSFECIRDANSEYSAPLLPLLINKREDIVFAGSCLINEGKIAAELGREETETAIMVRGEKCIGTLSFDVIEKGKKTDKVSVQCSNDRKIKVSQKDGQYLIEITVILKGSIIEHNKPDTPIKNSKDLLKLSEKSLENEIKRKANAFVKKTKEQYGFDALNAAKYISAHTRKKLSKKDIDKIIQEADIKVNVKVNIENSLTRM